MADENKYNIKIECGTDFVLPFVWTDDNGNPYNLTGATVTAQLREYSGSPDALDFVCTHNNAGGRIMLIMPNEVTKDISFSYGIYDVRVVLESGEIKKPLYGDAKIQDDVTKPIDGTALYMIGIETYDDLPTEGITNRLYFVYEDRKIYRWNGSNYIATAVGNGIQDITYLDGGTYRMVFDDGTYFDFDSVPRIMGVHDSSAAYEKLDIVHSSTTGATYIAKVQVPEDTALTNTTYWMQMTPKTFTIGTVEDVAYDVPAEVTVSGTPDAPVLNFKVPRGVTGNESIDDVAGDGDDDVVWSADKSNQEIYHNGACEIKAVWTKGSYGNPTTTQKTTLKTTIKVPKCGVSIRCHGIDITDVAGITGLSIGTRYVATKTTTPSNYSHTSAGYDWFPYVAETPYLAISVHAYKTSSTQFMPDADLTDPDFDLGNYVTTKLYYGNIANSCFRPSSLISSFASPNTIKYGYYNTRNKNDCLAYALPLKNIDYVATGNNYSVFVKVYKYDLINDDYAFIEDRGITIAKDFGYGSNYVDLSDLGDNYFGVALTSMDRLNKTSRNSATLSMRSVKFDSTLGLDPYEPLYIHWNSKAEIAHHAKGGNATIQENLDLIKSIKVRKPFISVPPDSEDGILSLCGSENVSGIMYSNVTFYWRVSPQAYFTALQNPNSLAYKNFENTDAGSIYGIQCSGFVSMLLGSEVPNGVFGLRYTGEVSGLYDFQQIKLDEDIYKIDRNDFLLWPTRNTGHTVMVNDVLSIDGKPYIDIYEASHPTTRHRSWFYSNALPYEFNKPKDTLTSRYGYIMKPNSEAIGRISEHSNWNIPYTDATWTAMNHRGYGSIYLLNATTCYVTFTSTTLEFKLTLDDVVIGTYTVSNLSPTEVNGYYIADISALITNVGQYKIVDAADDSVLDTFYVIDPSPLSVTCQLVDDKIVFECDNYADIDWIYFAYENTEGYVGSISFKWGDSSTLEIPIRLDSVDGDYAVTDLTKASNATLYRNSGICDQRFIQNISTGVIGL